MLESQSYPNLCDPMDGSPQAPLSMGFSRQQYWMGCHALLQGIFLAKGGTHISCLLHWQVGSLPLVPPRKPNILTLSMKYHLTALPRGPSSRKPVCRSSLSLAYTCPLRAGTAEQPPHFQALPALGH